MAQLLTVRLTRGDAQPWGFRLQGGKDFGTPLLVQKVNSGSLADQVGLIAGDAVIKINGIDVFDLRHKDAQDVVVKAGNNVEISVQRGGSTWKPNVTPTGLLPSPNLYGGLSPVTKTSLAHKTPDGRPISAIGTGYNNAARPFNSPTGAPVKSIVNKQYNTPVGIYSDETIAETLSAQAEVLAGGVLGVNFKKNEKMYNSANSEVYKMLQEQDTDEPELENPNNPYYFTASHAIGGHSRSATPSVHSNQLGNHHASSAVQQQHIEAKSSMSQSNYQSQTIQESHQSQSMMTAYETESGVFVRIKDKNLHAECFKCATCGSSLKNQGYYNVNNKLYCDVHARQAAIQRPPQGTQGYSPIPIKPDSKIGANIISAALNSKSSNYNGTSQTNNNCYIITPSHSRTNSSDSSRSLSNRNSRINSNRTTPSQSGKSSPILNGIKSEIIINLTDRLDDRKNDFVDAIGVDENDNRKYNLYFQTLNGGTIRSVKPPGKGYDINYKINNPYAAPKPYNYSQPPQAGPKSPSSYPPSVPSWTQPHDYQVNQGKFNSFGPSYQELCCAQEICDVMSNNMINVQSSGNYSKIESLNWPPTTKSSAINESDRFTPTASPLYIQPPETVHYEARVHTQTSSSIQQQQKLQQHEQYTSTNNNNNNLLKSNIDLESSSESYTSTSAATTVSSDEQQQKQFQTSLTHANQMNNYSDIDLSEYDLSALQHYKMSLCSSEVNDIVGRRSVQECAESVSDSINTQLLIDAVKESSPRPASPIPKPYKRIEFANEKPSPKVEQVTTEGSQTIDGSLQNTYDDETELIDLRSVELDDEALIEKYNIPETKAISPTNIPNPMPQKYQSEMLKALKAESIHLWRPVSTPTIEIEDYENHAETRETEMKCAMTKQSEKSVHEEICIKKEAKTKDQVTSVIEVLKEPRVEKPVEAVKSGFMTSLLTTAPSQPMEFVQKPSTEPVPLPEETVPYIPPPISMVPIIRDDDWGRSKTPLHSALIVAPCEPYSSFGKEVSSQLDDLPRPNPNDETTLAGALTVAPERPYTPFNPASEQIYNCCVSEPVYIETKPVEQDTFYVSETTKSSAFANVNGFGSTSTFNPRVEALNWYNSTPLPYHKIETIQSSDTTCTATQYESSNVCTESTNVETKVDRSCVKPIQRQPPPEHPTTLSYQKKPYYSGLHKPDAIPVYQKDLMKLPSQTPVRPPESPQLRENVPIAFLDTPEFASNLHKPIAISASNQKSQSSTSKIETQSYVENKSVSFAENRTGTITMAFQSLDQYDDQQHQNSFTPTNRPVTPSLINKPAPTIPYYQKNLCPVDCKPTDSHVFDPHSRSPSPYPDRAKSPAPGPPANPLRAVCPRIKEKPTVQVNKQLETEIKTQITEKADQKTNSLVGFKNLPVQQQNLPLAAPQSTVKPITTYTSATSQFADVKNATNYDIEKHASAAKFTEIPKTVQEKRIGDMNVQTTVQGSAMAQKNKSEKQSSQTTNVGNMQIQRRTRVVEEFERSRSEKQMEIVKTQGDMSRHVTFDQYACGGAVAAVAATAVANNIISKKEGFVAKQARRLSHDTSDALKKFPTTIDLSAPMTSFPSISSSPKVRREENLPRVGGFSLPATPCSITQLSSNTKAESASSFKSQQKHEHQMNTLTRQHKQEQQKSIASSITTTAAAYTNANEKQQQLSSYKKIETAPTTAKNVVNNTKYPQTITTKPSYPPMLVSSSMIQAPASNMPQKLTQQKITPNAVVSDSSPASAGSNSTKGAAFGATTAPRRGRGTLNKGVGPGARVPLCGCCNTQIRGPFITALGRIWCPDHFVCSTSNCKRPLQDIGFVEEKNQLYCEFCFEKYLAPSCSKCNSKIKGDCLNAIGKQYHPECFTCAYCGKLFGNSPFFLEEGDPYCEADWNEMFTTKCFACGFPVEAGDRWVEALNNNYHSQCFNCSMCKKNLEGQSFVAKGGRPFCKNHGR